MGLFGKSDDWYNPGEYRHLTEGEIASLASGGSVSPLASQHYLECDDCRRSVTRYEKSNWYPSGEFGFLHHESEESQESYLYRHLTEGEIEAIAASNVHLVSPQSLEHYRQCHDCSRAVTRAEKRAF